MSTDTSLGEYLREARLERGDSLRSFATQMQIAASYLSDIENGRRTPAEDVLRKMSEALHRDINVLLAMAGRLDAGTERFIRSSPEAVQLFRRISERNLSPEEIRNLTKIVDSPSQDPLDI